jgi:FtsP/CotA-like multicopper oxidase with cupredoxin domain
MPSATVRRSPFLRVAALIVAPLIVAPVLSVVPPAPTVRATSDASPYDVPIVVDANPDPNVVETTITADEETVDIGGGVMANVQAYNGAIPGPEFRLTVGQRVIVHFVNHLDSEGSAIHWHGIELANNFDGTPLTQNHVAPGGTYLYDFVVTRPGVFWYHPHHETSTNQVFKGLYGSLIVTDPNESALVAAGTIPGVAATRSLVLSDITVCKAPGSNDAETYDPALPWVGGGPLPVQKAPTPTTLCDTPIDAHGDPLPQPLQAGDVPNIQKKSGRVNEGQTVLTNGKNVGGRQGTPAAPGALDAGASTLSVQPGQGLRLRIVNTAATRFFRLRLTAGDGSLIPLVRIGGEGGLLDAAVEDGTAPGGFDYLYEQGEILLDPGDRADVVAAIPASATGVATLWTEDFPRTGGGDGQGGWMRIPTVPVAHLEVTGTTVSPAFTIAAGTPLRSATGDPVEVLPAPTGTLLDPASFSPPKIGLSSTTIHLTATADGVHAGIDNVSAMHDSSIDYALQDHIGSARYAKLGDVLELAVENTTASHHPYHLHGFSMQPLSLSGCPGTVTGTSLPHEFVDNIDVPPGCTMTFRLRLEDRPLVDGVTPGGGMGRWMMHCHIFFHHHFGMASELVVTDADGNERPYLDALDTSVSVSEGGTATAQGTITDPDGDQLSLAASLGSLLYNGGGTWSWSYAASDGPFTSPVFITATDSHGNRSQVKLELEVLSEAPTVTLDPAQLTSIDEGGTVPVAATFVDPGDDDPYTATIDWGDGSGPQAISPTLTGTTPPQAGSVAGSFQYGDNGTFSVTVSVTDKDGETGSASFEVVVGNVDPSAVIETAGPILAEAGDLLAFDGRATDPGSDDLTTVWSFDDGSTDSEMLSLVNPPNSDGLPSPSVQPRDIEHDVSHAFAAACTYDVTFAATDDDGGTDVAHVQVVVTATSRLSRGAGYWQREYKRSGMTQFSAAELQCYLDIVAAMSDVFNEVRDAGSIGQAYDNIFVAGLRGSMLEQLDRQLLTAWLNYANGGVELTELLDTDADGVADTTFAAVMATAEAVRLDSTSTTAELQEQRNLLEAINQRDGV